MDAQSNQSLLTVLAGWAQLFTAVFTGVTALATVALVRATLELVKTTTKSMGEQAERLREQTERLREQTERAKKAQSTASSCNCGNVRSVPKHAARRRRVIALLKHLEERNQNLSTRDLEFSPDINLLLNDYQWIGRLVKDDALQEEYAYSTYGRNLLLLYPKLKRYIKKEQKDRKYPTLWESVDDLYKKFKQLDDKDKLDENKLTESDIEKQLKREKDVGCARQRS